MRDYIHFTDLSFCKGMQFAKEAASGTFGLSACRGGRRAGRQAAHSVRCGCTSLMCPHFMASYNDIDPGSMELKVQTNHWEGSVPNTIIHIYLR